MKKSTEDLMELIQNTNNIEIFLDENQSEMQNTTLDDYLNQLLKDKGQKISNIIENSGQSDYIYKVFKNERKASRDILLAIALAMKLDLNQTQRLLRIAPVARLDPRNNRDTVIIYAITHELGVIEVNEILYDLGESTL